MPRSKEGEALELMTASEMNHIVYRSFNDHSLRWSAELRDGQNQTDGSFSLKAVSTFDAENRRRSSLCCCSYQGMEVLVELQYEEGRTFFRMTRGSFPFVLGTNEPWRILENEDAGVGISYVASGQYVSMSPCIYMAESHTDDSLIGFRQMLLRGIEEPIAVAEPGAKIEVDLSANRVQSMHDVHLGNLALNVDVEDYGLEAYVPSIRGDEIVVDSTSIVDLLSAELARMTPDIDHHDDGFGL